MAPTMQSLGIDTLSPADKMALIGEIWDSLSSPETDPAIEAEIERRLDEEDSNPQPGITFDKLKSRLLSEA